MWFHSGLMGPLKEIPEELNGTDTNIKRTDLMCHHFIYTKPPINIKQQKKDGFWWVKKYKWERRKKTTYKIWHLQCCECTGNAVEVHSAPGHIEWVLKGGPSCGGEPARPSLLLLSLQVFGCFFLTEQKQPPQQQQQREQRQQVVSRIRPCGTKVRRRETRPLCGRMWMG